ncbi:Paxillin 1 [Parelaphostrongylus tenuis]|uniref:Paxillin 1 n=1 Tax=Parelaphostrongylus tenuis TaxID=148309 RepID=A0AAD5MUR7_PARTN|nr:Paxillin 1 [Parelaphostrongylus tenuis]
MANAFEDLEALLSDLQHTTEVLRRANTASPPQDIEPIYQEQTRRGNINSKRSVGSPSQATSYNDTHSARSPSHDPLLADPITGTINGDFSSRHGISTIPKGDCAQCDRPIIGQVVIALGKMWHPEHYTCFECGLELGHRNFFERNGRAYCEEDYHNLFSPRCSGCNGPIKDRCVTALNKNYHVQCFTCSECGREFGDEGFHEKDGNTYCRP